MVSALTTTTTTINEQKLLKSVYELKTSIHFPKFTNEYLIKLLVLLRREWEKERIESHYLIYVHKLYCNNIEK